MAVAIRAGPRRLLRGRERRAPGLPPPRGDVGLLGMEARLLRRRGGCKRLLRRALPHARHAARGAELPAVVQHRAALGVRHHRPAAGPPLRRAGVGGARALHQRVRAPAAARLLHPVRRRRPRQRGRHHGSLDARGARLQVRLRHRIQLLGDPRRGRAALRRRTVVRADVVPEDRRPRGRRHQVRRHDAARREDGDRRRRPPRRGEVHRLEGRRGAQGRDDGCGLARSATASLGDPRRRPQRGRRARRPGAGPGDEPAAPAGHPPGAAGRRPRALRAARSAARRAGRAGSRSPHLRHRLAGGGLPERLRAELQQLGAGLGALPRRHPRRAGVGAQEPHRRRGLPHAPRARPVGAHRPGGVAERRPRPSVRHHGQRVAHLAGRRAHQRLQSLLRVHVPRRHRVQSRLAQSPAVPRRGERRLRHRGLRARGTAVDDRPGDLGADGAVPEPRDRAALIRLPHPRSGLREHRRAADGAGHPVRLPRGARVDGSAHGDPHRHLLRRLGGAGGGPRPVPPLRREPRRDAARDAQPPARGLRGPRRRVRGALRPAGPARRGCVPSGSARRGADGLGPGGRPRGGARLPQRAGDAHRPHGHHRPADGLRHDRGRAGLRAREVQEARRRRLLPHHQSRGPAGARPPRLPPRAGRRDRGLLRRLGAARGCPLHQPPHAGAGRAHAAGARPHRRVAPHGLPHPLRLQPLHAGRAALRGGAGRLRGGVRRPGLRHAGGARLRREPRSRPRTTTSWAA